MFPHSNPKLLHYLRTNWLQDPYSKSSFSFIKAGSKPEDYHRFKEPVGDKLWFAGEHTIMEFIGTVTGAYISGERAAA